MEQLVARRAHNPKVVGSSPTPATNLRRRSVIGNISDCHSEDCGFDAHVRRTLIPNPVKG